MAGRERCRELPRTYGEVLDVLGEKTLLAIDKRHLTRLIEARNARDEAGRQLSLAEAEVDSAAKAAAEAGDSWRTIGVVLGVSRQAAQQRYGRTPTAPDQPADHEREDLAPHTVRPPER